MISMNFFKIIEMARHIVEPDDALVISEDVERLPHFYVSPARIAVHIPAYKEISARVVRGQFLFRHALHRQ